MKKFTSFISVILLMTIFSCQKKENTISSPDGKIKVVFSIQQGEPVYSVYKDNALLLKDSHLGIKTQDEDFSTALKFISANEEKSIQDDFNMYQGKRRKIHYEANEKKFLLENSIDNKMTIEFRVSNDGVAFRYVFPNETPEEKEIISENTSFHFNKNATAFLQPMSVSKTGWSKVNPCYEEFYEKEISVGTPSPSTAGWVYPALFHSDSVWLLITEAGLRRNHCATHLAAASPNGEYFVSFPDSLQNFPGGRVNPKSKFPFETPWRIITIGSLKNIVESDLGIALADASTEKDTTYIKPGYSSWSWALLKDDSTIFEEQKKFIDYAAQMNWKYCLVDADWDKKIGYGKMKELSTYAQAKNIALILWYNSSGSWNETPYTPREKLLTHESREVEFQKLNDMGIKGIKVDFFGGDGQSMIAYYIDILQDAAKHKLLVNFHGATLPRGWQRTYPNLMNTEAVKGFEYVTFEQKNADEEPAHCATLPFTRNVFDPMDFTPLSLDSVPRINRKTTRAFELALAIIFQGGIQHFVEIPRGMKKQPEYVKDFLKTLPTRWTDSKFIEGYPSKDFVIARVFNKRWYVAGINGENKSKTFSLDLSFLPQGNYSLITDAGKSFEKKMISVNDKTSITVQPNGGFVLVKE